MRRVRRLNPAAGQDELLPGYRHHAVFTDTPLTLLQAEACHRGHAIVEQVIADLKGGLWGARGLDHLGETLSPQLTVRLRARHTWIAAVDLGNGGSFADFPPALLDQLIHDAGAERAAAGERRTGQFAVQVEDTRLSDVARWLWQRGDRRVMVEPSSELSP